MHSLVFLERFKSSPETYAIVMEVRPPQIRAADLLIRSQKPGLL